MWRIREFRIGFACALICGLLLLFGGLLHHLGGLGRIFVASEKAPKLVAILCAWLKVEISAIDSVLCGFGFALFACSSIGLIVAHSGFHEKRLIFLTLCAIEILGSFFFLKTWTRNAGFYPNYATPYHTCLAFQICALIGFAGAAHGLNLHVDRGSVAKTLVTCGLVCAVMAVPASRWGYMRQPYGLVPGISGGHVSLTFTMTLFAASLFLCLSGIVAILLSFFYGKAFDEKHFDLPPSTVVFVDGYH